MKAQVLLLALVAGMAATSVPTSTQADSEITRSSSCCSSCSSCGCNTCKSCSGCSSCNTCSCSSSCSTCC